MRDLGPLMVRVRVSVRSSSVGLSGTRILASASNLGVEIRIRVGCRLRKLC